MEYSPKIDSLKPIIGLLRPKHWIKNLLIFAPLFFNMGIGDKVALFNTTLAFIAFCFMASSVYCFNDIFDKKEDQLHPVKKNRPIASGAISEKQAYFLMAFLMMLSFLILIIFIKKNSVTFPFLNYLVINLLYTTKLKHIPIVDFFILSIGFVIRIMIGGEINNIELSIWIEIMTFLLAMFLAIAKRMDDVILIEEKSVTVRRVSLSYNYNYLSVLLSICSAVIIISYLMYTISDEVMLRFKSDKVYYSSMFVIAGLFRYLQLAFVDLKTGNPTEVLYKDKFIQLAILGWILHFSYLAYF